MGLSEFLFERLVMCCVKLAPIEIRFLIKINFSLCNHSAAFFALYAFRYIMLLPTG